ncbi:MAG: TIGR03857 family LLM class F420-dependent oxidoreductase [Gammaproteobacteria bacterium]|jgi:probable F420-dependent oxidoreductase|nr:TIGR03857 family LLM class F420-dependent oxidoreductase [Gammaproteobacteria bacterium]MBT5204088.1 TIGR03857 family LLM class F420-dependent oxidoreductase [Gammaproteobacteria bacterium]MBT5602050.1 TIGR03857 family LLM class F420-dependent oxidoreductase [Gammaproteobacteria bacterium]MBT6247365.1 TIGR03857 family LLM class F420-dependent oxidoreductase [Gammaproteobacteria bacterium]
MNPSMNEIGFYGLAGAPESPRDLIEEIRTAENMGIGSCFLSERFNIKEIATLSGMAGAVSKNIGIVTAATNQNTRHPIVTAAFASTMHFLTQGRFSLGLGRGIKPVSRALGLSNLTTAMMEDFANLMRRLHHGETIIGHNGPAGTWPVLHLDAGFNETIPLTLMAFGPNSLELAGRCYDAVVLHTFFTDETTSRAIKTVKQAAERAGRDPRDIRVWSCLATVGDHLEYPVQLKKTVGRMGTYLQAYGDLMVKTNQWDKKILENFRNHALVSNFRGSLDQKATVSELEQVAELIPKAWLENAATGTPANCVTAIQQQFELGVDGVILHGASPSELAPVIEAYRQKRNAASFAHLPANPALPPLKL